MHFSRTIPLRDLHAPVSLSIQTVYHAIPYIRSIFLIQGNNGRAATSWRAVIYFRVSREKREKKITRPFPSSLRVRVWGRRSWEGKSRHVRRDLRDDISPRIVDKTFRNRSFGSLDDGALFVVMNHGGGEEEDQENSATWINCSCFAEFNWS